MTKSSSKQLETPSKQTLEGAELSKTESLFECSYSTPQVLPLASSTALECELCSICWSPFPVIASSPSNSSNHEESSVIPNKHKTIVNTSCQHRFHQDCLHEAKRHQLTAENKCSCPLCRTELSPLPVSPNNHSTEQGSDRLRRMAVMAAAARGREAVRRAMFRRIQQQQQQVEQQLPPSSQEAQHDQSTNQEVDSNPCQLEDIEKRL